MPLNPYTATSDIDLAALGGYMQLCNAPLVAWAINVGQAALDGHQINPGDLVAARPTLRALLWDRRVVDDQERFGGHRQGKLDDDREREDQAEKSRCQVSDVEMAEELPPPL